MTNSVPCFTPSRMTFKYKALSAQDDDDQGRLGRHGIDAEEYEMQISPGDTEPQLHEIDGIHDGLVCPSDDEYAVLRRVADAIPWDSYCTSFLSSTILFLP